MCGFIIIIFNAHICYVIVMGVWIRKQLVKGDAKVYTKLCVPFSTISEGNYEKSKPTTGCQGVYIKTITRLTCLNTFIKIIFLKTIKFW